MVSTLKHKNSNLDNTVNKSQKECKTIYSFYKKINTDNATIDQEHDDIIQQNEWDTGTGTQSFSEEEGVIENIIINSNISILPVKTNTNTDILSK